MQCILSQLGSEINMPDTLETEMEQLTLKCVYADPKSGHL